MKTLIGFLLGLAVLGLGFWAYQENYKTRDTVAEMRAVQADIVRLHAEMAMLRAEWAWLNRPDRLRMLIEANGAQLQLQDMEPKRFGYLDQVAYPAPPAAPDPGLAPAALGVPPEQFP